MNTVPKQALKDPLGWVRDATRSLGERAPERREALRWAEELVPLARRVRELEQRRGRTSRAIGLARKNATDATLLIATMHAISDETRTVERELRHALAELIDHLPEGEVAAMSSRSTSAASARSCPEYLCATRSVPRNVPQGVAVLPVRTARDSADYTRYVQSHPARTAYHEIGLGPFIAETLGQRCHHLLARDGDGVAVGILPLVHLQSRLFGNFMISMPWFNYGGPLAEDETTAEALLQRAAELARDAGCDYLESREARARAGWATRTHKVSMTLALPSDVDALERGLGASLRAQSNKAVRAGCSFRAGGRELLDDFYRVFSTNMRDIGTPTPSRAFFDGLLELFGDDAFLTVVSQGEKPLAAGFLLTHGDTLEIPWASSLRSANPLGVNMLLYRRTLGEAVARGYDHFDFGRSTEGGPTWRFKKQWGAEPRQLHWHCWTADGTGLPGLSQDNPRFRLAIAAWRRLPVALTRRLGPLIVRGLP